MRSWTNEEEAKLKEVYSEYSFAELAVLFGRSVIGVKKRAELLGLFRHPKEKKPKPVTKIDDGEERSKYGCMPNALIFLEPNWIDTARNIRLRDTVSRSPHHWGTFVVGRGNKED